MEIKPGLACPNAGTKSGDADEQCCPNAFEQAPGQKPDADGQHQLINEHGEIINVQEVKGAKQTAGKKQNVLQNPPLHRIPPGGRGTMGHVRHP